MRLDPTGAKGGERVTTLKATRVDDRIARIIRCLRLLQADCYSAHDLAGRFQVSKRTVYRDLRILERAGVPLVRRRDDRRYYVPDHVPT